MEYDYLIVGAGFFGSVCARELTDVGKRCLVIDRRDHIGGNCYTSNRGGIHVHEFGCHIFHTSNSRVWRYINRFATFNNFRYHGVARVGRDFYSLPFNMWTFHKVYGSRSPHEAMQAIKFHSEGIQEPRNLEEQAIMMVGRPVYEKLIKGYTEKQWGRSARELPKEIIKRLPIRLTFDSNYFDDLYQGIPNGGYTGIFDKLLNGIEVKTSIDYKANKAFFDGIAKHTIYTGAIDEFFDYKYGQLEYKTTRFAHHTVNAVNHQGAAVVNYPSKRIPYTRTIEHKHFDWIDVDFTIVTEEYPERYVAGRTEPYYPVNDSNNNAKYMKYKQLADSTAGVSFGGRLAEYRYYDMDDVIESALNFVDTLE